MPHSPKKLYEMYNGGFTGCLWEPENFEELMKSLKYPLFSGADKDVKGSGKGKLSTPFKSVLHFDKKAYEERQSTGDCQNASDLVTMADGSLKKIKDICIGEYVISALGKKQKVLDTFKKPFYKKMVELKLANHTKTASTPDHRYIVDNITMATKAIGELKKGDYIFMPKVDFEESTTFDMKDFFDGFVITEDTDYKKLRLESVEPGYIRAKNSACPIKRYIELDERLSWLVGLYAAEGGVDGVDNKMERITFNLGGHEAIIAEQVRQYMKDIFDVDAHIYQVPSKPTVIYARINSTMIAKLFKYLVNGNTYTKSLNKILFITKKKNKLAALKGWIDGDGHSAKKRTSSTSVSKQLVLDFAKLANDVNLKFSIYKIDKSHDSSRKDVYTLALNKESSTAIACEKTKYITKILLKSTIGCMIEIKDINFVEPEENSVYCIEVEKDHNFICNGFGISNCVSHGTRNACDLSRAVEIHINHEKESWVARGATEGIYGCRGHGGQGMSCSRAAQFVNDTGGILLRQKYDDVDLTKYNGSTGANWGSRGVPKDLVKVASEHQVKTTSLIKTVEEARDALYNGYGVNVCSNYGFSNIRNEKGISRTQGSWGHSMAWTACDDTGTQPYFLVQNSWGKWNSGGHPAWGPIPDGSFLIDSDTAAGMLNQNGAYAFSNFDGFPVQKLPSYGFEEYI